MLSHKDLGKRESYEQEGSRKGRKSAIERKDDESPFFGLFLYWTFVGKGFTIMSGTGWNKHFWMVVQAFWIASRLRAKDA